MKLIWASLLADSVGQRECEKTMVDDISMYLDDQCQLKFGI